MADKSSVIVFEDKPMFDRIYTAALKQLGYEDITFVRGGDAADLNIARNATNTIFITDYDMPAINGGQVLEAASGQHNNAVVMITGNPDQSILQAAVDEGAVAALAKQNVGPENLAAAIKAAEAQIQAGLGG